MSQNPIAAIAQFLNPGKTMSTARGDVQGASYTSQRHGPRYAATYNGAMALGANQAGVTLSAALATTYVGICLSNPAGSGRNLSVLRVAGTLNVAPAALTALGLITGYAAGGITVHTTPLTVQTGIVGNPAAATYVGLLDAACTLVGTPVWSDWLAETPGATSVTNFSNDYQGGLIIPPGGYVAVGATAAGPASGFLGSIWWEEDPI